MCKISLGTNFVRSTRRKKKDQYKTVFYSAFLALDNNTLVDVSFLCKYQSKWCAHVSCNCHHRSGLHDSLNVDNAGAVFL